MIRSSALVLSLLALSCAADRSDRDGDVAGPSCFDGSLNGPETDVDCGGTCAAKCANGRKCVAKDDCVSSDCASTTCMRASACEPELAAAICLRLGKTCGRLTAADRCGDTTELDCGSCPREVTCTGATTSGVSSSKALDALTVADGTRICDWMACAWGGYAKEVRCSESVTVGGPDDLEECLGEQPKCATVTVAEYEACLQKVNTDKCNAFAVIFGDPICAKVKACAGL